MTDDILFKGGEKQDSGGPNGIYNTGLIDVKINGGLDDDNIDAIIGLAIAGNIGSTVTNAAKGIINFQVDGGAGKDNMNSTCIVDNRGAFRRRVIGGADVDKIRYDASMMGTGHSDTTLEADAQDDMILVSTLCMYLMHGRMSFVIWAF